MDLDSNPTISQAHPETMDFLSRAWCNFAVQAFQPEMQDQALILHESSIKNSIIDNKPPIPMEKSMKMDDTDKSIPPWKSNDVKSWIWMQQAMHPELNYNSYFQKKWMPWKIGPLKNVSIKKWIKEIKQRRKEEKRLQKAEVHAAISVAGVAAALAAIAAENLNRDETGGTKESAVASAAALVAAQCAKVAEAMGAKRDQLTGVIGSAMSGTNASDILTLTAAATTSLRGAETLKARAGFKNILNGSTPVLPIEDSNDYNFNYEKCRSILSKGAELYIEKSDGRSKLRSVSIILNGEAKVILRTRKATMLKAFSRQKESVVLDLHVELYKDSNGEETDSCYLIVLTTNKGIIKLDMMDDHQRYRTWSMTINQMLTLSTSFPKYELQFYKS
ncbi:PREDICTED: VAN3-binding protein isoform X2 [Nicotiana attenuata]|uniref:VAN3-binding protein isoform X2 n=1 Tax=Nicotiana attenuata TaxID=49451 RepID=UPI0009053C69|nr:PREDICTED: VAN3-binding protein isoform X2 [Nicotiana attenuata]